MKLCGEESGGHKLRGNFLKILRLTADFILLQMCPKLF
jgi:hypothetical protein